METNEGQNLSQEQMIKEMHEYTRKTYNYMRWMFYITIVLVVLPILGIAFILPSLLKSVSSVYLQGLQ